MKFHAGKLCIDFITTLLFLTLQPGFEDESSFDRSPIIRYCAVSSIEHSHKTVVSDITWIPDHMEVQLSLFVIQSELCKEAKYLKLCTIPS